MRLKKLGLTRSGLWSTTIWSSGVGLPLMTLSGVVVAAVELEGVVVADRDDGDAGVGRLQVVEEVGERLGLLLALLAHARAVARDQLDVDERAEVVDDDEDAARVRARRVNGRVEDEGRPVVQDGRARRPAP